MKATVVTVGELASPEPGSFKIGPFGSSLKKDELVKEGIPIVGIENVLSGNFARPFRRHITAEKYAELSDYGVQPSDILVTTMGTIGCAAVVPQIIETMIFDSHLFRMRVDQSKVYPSYLCYALNGYEGIKRHLEQMSRGAIMDGLNTSILKECPLPLPPLPEQRRLAALLDRADRADRLRRYALELSETYLQSVFLEMFGDPVKNDKGWEVDGLGELCEPKNGIKAGPFGSSLKKEFYTDRGYRIYGQEQVIAGDFRMGDYYISREMFADFLEYEVQPGDVLISLVGTFGKVVVVPDGIEPGIINPRLLKVSPRPNVLNPTFLAQLFQMHHVQKSLEHISHGGTMGILNAGILRELRVIAPPLKLQERFVSIAQKHERLRAQQREALRQAEMLFGALLKRAFEGE